MTFLVFSVLPAPDSPLTLGQLLFVDGYGILRDKDTLVLPLIYKVSKRSVCHGKDMGLYIFATLTFVHPHEVAAIYRQWAVRIDSD